MHSTMPAASAWTLVVLLYTANTLPVYMDEQDPVIKSGGYLDETDLQVLLKHLNKEQAEQEIAARNRAIIINEYIEQNHRWLKKTRAIPNYLTLNRNENGGYVRQQIAKGDIALVGDYEAISGTSTKCLMNAVRLRANKKREYESPTRPPTHPPTRKKLMDFNTSLRDTYYAEKNPRLYLGAMNDICLDESRPCYRILFLQDPLEKAKISYDFCKISLHKKHELCQVLNANDVSLKDWIIHQSNHLLHHFMFRREMCQIIRDSNGTAHKKSMPCWYRHKEHFNKLPERDKANIIEYIINNMEKEFSMIALLDNYDDSLLTMERVFQMSLQECINSKDTNVNADDNMANKHPNPSTRRSGYDTADQLGLLKYDYDVQRAIETDTIIYRKARDIFKIQKQILLNKIDI